MATDVKKLIEQMTLEEKASLLGGDDFWHTKPIERLGIPRFMMSDGPHGLRKQAEGGDHLGMGESIKAVCFPAACATASSFDPDLLYEMGDAIGEECQAEDLAMVLGPGVNMKRSPLCGRNFEYYSEDPYLAGKMAASYIRGVQSRHVATSVKHFAANNQETGRMNISSEVDERTLREIYLPAFEIAVRESQPKSVMCAYNKLNGVFAADHEWLLSKVLRNDWGFQGFVVTDWGAVSDRVQGVRAGLELEMPGNTASNDRKIVSAVKAGTLSEAVVDRAVERLLTALFDYYDHREAEHVFHYERDHALATRIEAECAVLLENNGVLPLRDGMNVVYIGEFAEKPRFQGGGSSHINAFKVTSALSSAWEKGRSLNYVRGFPADRDETDPEELLRAVNAAKAADVAVIFAGLPETAESEGYDRKDMKLPSCQNALIEAVLSVQPNTVVVLHNGSPVEAPWADRVAAVLELYLGGQGVGEATDRLLYGEVNPSGHLAETFPLRAQDNPSWLNFPGNGKKVRYAEGIYVGYRYYEKKELPVRWAFGHGLSYTSFAMKNMRLDRSSMDDDSVVTVSVDVQNTGKLAGKEVVQLYVSDRNGTADRPVKELKGFAKVSLEPGETKTVSFTLDARALSYYDTELGDWFAPSGTYTLLAGDASDHILVSTELSFTTKKLLPFSVGPDTTFAQLLADPRTAPIVQQMMAAAGQQLTATLADNSGAAGIDADPADMVQEIMLAMPLKSIASFGMIPEEQLQGIIEMLKAAVER